MVTPNARRPQSIRPSPRLSPPLATERIGWLRLSPAARIIFSAVGGRKALRTPVPRHQREGLRRIELRHPPRHHRHAQRQRRHQDVQEPADPGPVRRRPDPVPLLAQEVVADLHPRQVAREHPVPVQRALGRARGAGGVDQDRRIVRPGLHQGKRPAARPRRAQVLAVRGCLHAQDVPQHGQRVPQPRQRRRPGRIGDRRRGARAAEPVHQRLRPEQPRERQRHRPTS